MSNNPSASWAVIFIAENIKKLPKTERLVLALHYQDELTFREIGLVLDITELDVLGYHRRALAYLANLALMQHETDSFAP